MHVHALHREGYETLVHMVNKQWFGTLGNDVFNDVSGNIQCTLCSIPVHIQIPNKDLLRSRLPVVCPVGRPMAGYRVPRRTDAIS